MEDMETDQLVEFGLTKNQALVYVTLLKNPNISVTQISKITKLDRSFSYSIIDSLIKKGLVSYKVSKNRREFSAKDPAFLLEEIEEKKTKAQEIIKYLKGIKVEKKID